MENICRTCLRVPNNLTPLYSDVSLIDKIETIASIQVISGENYPSNICQECIKNVNILYNFRKVIINNDKELRERNETLDRVKDTQQDHLAESMVKNENNHLVESHQESEPESHLGTEIDESVKKAIAKMKICKCDICNLTFASRFKLYKHRRSAHIATGVCNVCGMIVRTDNLKRHVALHLATPVECGDCGKVFKNSESLRSHKLVHKGTVFTCEICGRTFKVKAEYKRHFKSHIDPEIRKSMCSICGKKVRDMKKHINSHTGERPYSCEFCMKGFTSPYSLKVHTRQHTNERPYVCEFCPVAFPQKVSLVNHLKSKHNLV